MKNRFFSLAALAAICLAYWSVSLHAADAAPKQPKNIILMIGDGMGFNQHVAGTYWRCGTLGKQTYEKFPVCYGVTTFSTRVKEPIPADFKGYDPEIFWAGLEGANMPTPKTETSDSASAATSIYTGTKTFVGRISVDPNDKPLITIGEHAKQKGKSVGVISTGPLCDATPCAVGAHNVNRDNGGDIINEMLHRSCIDVMIGGGNPQRGIELSKFDSAKVENPETMNYGDVGGKENWDALQAGTLNGFVLVQTKAELEKIAAAKTNVPKRIASFPNVSQPIPPVDGMPDGELTNETKEVIAEVLGDNAARRDVPTLSLMSLAALNSLNQNDKGFFLMVESAVIDWVCHGHNTKRLVMEQTAFAKAVDAVCDWVDKNSSWDETVVIVTADHETAQLWGPGTYIDKKQDDKFETLNDIFIDFKPIQNNGVGKLPGTQFGFSNHTSSLVPLWAKGASVSGLERYVRGTDSRAGKFWGFSGKYIDNTDISRFMLDCLKE
ncbi:MAG: alkaline phosphatase [Thermoguttaceae bacterium]